MFDEKLLNQAQDILAVCREKKFKLATAESCTGGLICALFTEIPGSSDVFDRGFVTYSNQSKMDLLGVNPNLINKHGAVSEAVASIMAERALDRAKVDIAVSVTGVAGPGGGSEHKPVGLVFIAVAMKDSIQVEECFFSGDRAHIRIQAVTRALNLIKDTLEQPFTLIA